MLERILLGSSANSGWIVSLDPSTAVTVSMQAISVDASGNVYVGGHAGGYAYSCKLNSSGILQWQRILGDSVNEQYAGISTDTSGNVYCMGMQYVSSTNSNDGLIVKYDSSGALQWQRRLGGTALDGFYGGTGNSSGVTYQAGFTTSQTAGGYDFLVTSYNAAGTLAWQRRLGGTNTEICTAIAIDGSNNVYAVGYGLTQTAGSADAYLLKYNSTGTLQFQRRIGSANLEYYYGVGLDSSGNIFCTGYTYNNTTQAATGLITKYNSAGTLQWQRITNIMSSATISVRGAVDGSGNTYMGASEQSYSSLDAPLLKVDTSGNLLWSRTLTNSAFPSSASILSITTDNSGFVYICGEYNGDQFTTPKGFVAKLPQTGAGTGTYGPWTYAAGSYTLSTSTLTAATPTLTGATTTLTSAASTQTDAAGTLTTTVTTL